MNLPTFTDALQVSIITTTLSYLIIIILSKLSIIRINHNTFKVFIILMLGGFLNWIYLYIYYSLANIGITNFCLLYS